MKLVVLSGMLVIAFPCSAQSVPAAAAHSTLAEAAPQSQNCPAELQARRARTGGVISSGPHGHHDPLIYALALRPVAGKGVVEASGVLHGQRGAHVSPASQTSAAEVTEPFRVSLAEQPDHFFRSAIFASELTGVRWMDIQDIGFNDGSHWHASASSWCRVAPDGYLLVHGS